ncbi:unnamed protein product [Rhizoctonia solani]|uniref:MYND-type domain-containing protein n=1 Tax=Rhizoctonia solani TaxID=456999 RepID=A0A8H3AK31_9AGAM|nr:unnamed protein product [Rhizoctonia solani]
MDRSENVFSFSRLGMPLKQYILIYQTKLNEALDPPNTESIKACIAKVSELGRAGRRISNEISISTIRPILLYSYSPLSYQDLSSPALISGCLKIMSSLELLDVVSPFSHELGYACFRIILLSLGLCLARRAHFLGFIDSNFDGDDPDTVWRSIAHLIKSVVLRTGDQLDDCALGWFNCPNHKLCSAIISLAEAKTLLRLIFNDRKRFIRAIRSTYVPGLPTLVYFMWKYVPTQRFSNDRALAKELDTSLKEVFWRSWIVSTDDDRVALEAMANRDQRLLQINKEDKGDCPIDNEDGNELIEILIDRLTQQTLDPVRYKSFSLGDFSVFIDFMAYRIFPTLCHARRSARCFGAIIEWLWGVLSNPDTCDAQFNMVLGRATTWFSEAISENSKQTGQELDMRIIDEIINTDYFNLVGRSMLRLVPPFGDSHTSDRKINAMVFMGTRRVVRRISKLAPVEALRQRFQIYVGDWWKVYVRLAFLSSEPLSTIPALAMAQKELYEVCCNVWVLVADVIQEPPDDREYPDCHNLRCSNPTISSGVYYSCSSCHRGEYCSVRCQVKDWLNDYGSISHCVLCTAILIKYGAEMPTQFGARVAVVSKGW